MDKQHFNQRVKGVKAMKRHLADKPVRGAWATKLPAPCVPSSAKPQRSGRAGSRG